MTDLSEEIDEILDTIEEARRRIGVRRWRNIKHMKTFTVKRKGKGTMVRRARMIHHAIRRGPVHNRHR